MKLGIERIVSESNLQKELRGKRLALLAHPASVDHSLHHSLDLLTQISGLTVTAGFGPQHGIKGDKQDNMVETVDEIDPKYNIPIFSLYGKVRRPTFEMMDTFDVLLIDLQDIGTRIYTFVTTLRYMLEEAARYRKIVWILDRPNPIGRNIEGAMLEPGWESFVGAGAMPMRHGLTFGELAIWFKTTLRLDLDLKVIEMTAYDPNAAPGFGWPTGELSWVNPSPNAQTLSMARCFPGTVLLEGTTLSEGRGTTRALELLGAPDLSVEKILILMKKIKSTWTEGCTLRPCYFEPTFHKHAGKLCTGFQIHVDHLLYDPKLFKPYRLMALFFKALKKTLPTYELWRKFHYEYESERLAIDLLNGGEGLRDWVDDPTASVDEFEEHLCAQESRWSQERKAVLLYSDLDC